MKYANRVDVNSLIAYKNKDDALKTNEYFFDDISGKKWTAFVSSIENDGINEPIIITPESNRIISGHQRVRAAKAIGLTEVPVIYATEELQKIVTDDDGNEHYVDDEDKILLCLIETNLKQRGETNNSVKMGRCIIELERLYGIRNGNNQYGRVGNNCQPTVKQEDLASMVGMTVRNLSNYKRLAELPMAIQNMILAKNITPTTALNRICPLEDDTQALLIEEFKKLNPEKKYSDKEIKMLIAKILGEKVEDDSSDDNADTSNATHEATDDTATGELQKRVDNLTVKNDELTARIASITEQLHTFGLTCDEDGNIVKEIKRRGRPAGSKNKPKTDAVAA